VSLYYSTTSSDLGIMLPGAIIFTDPPLAKLVL